MQSYNAKLSDFGLAKLGTTVMGTPGYAAPEYMQTGIYAVYLFIAFNCKIKFIQLFETEIYALCRAGQWRSQDYSKKNCNTFIGVYKKNCKQIIKKLKEIAQFIGVYIRNSEGFTKEIAKNLGQSPGDYPGPPGLETAHDAGHLYLKSDVYGFGVILVEILTGLRAIDPNRPRGFHCLTYWIRPHLQDRRKLKKIMDPLLKDKYPIKAALPIAKLATRCLAPEPKMRPSMKDVLEMLQRIQAATNRTVEVRGAN